MIMTEVGQHNDEMQENLKSWSSKPVLQKIYRHFHQSIADCLPSHCPGFIVELGSGIPDIRAVIPECIRTDVFPNPWVDQVENAYALSFPAGSVSTLILFDVFHHLRFPGTALAEFDRVLKPGGRVIIFDPCMSVLGRLVYGLLHHEPIAIKDTIEWLAPADWSAANVDYYAAQGNASRIFLQKEIDVGAMGWRIEKIQRFSAIAYVLSGGYSKPQMYPDGMFPLLQKLDAICHQWPAIFATRLLVVLEKPPAL
jgi:SAM-dependent methyltransferase